MKAAIKISDEQIERFVWNTILISIAASFIAAFFDDGLGFTFSIKEFIIITFMGVMYSLFPMGIFFIMKWMVKSSYLTLVTITCAIGFLPISVLILSYLF